MKLMSFLFLLTCTMAVVYSQPQNPKTFMKTIEVTGSAERSITPDEIIFSISIEEYWEEEFQGKKYEEYRTKVEIETIEDSLMQELIAAQFTMADITLKHTGNYYRHQGKDFLINKTIEIKLRDFEQANDLSNRLRTRGIRNMSISEMKHKNIEEVRLEVQAEALQKARKKAEYLAAAAGQKVKGVITIIEIDRNAGIMPRPVAYAREASAMMADSAGSSGAQYENFQKIVVKAEVRVIWELD